MTRKHPPSKRQEFMKLWAGLHRDQYSPRQARFFARMVWDRRKANG